MKSLKDIIKFMAINGYKFKNLLNKKLQNKLEKDLTMHF
jgi:hypothetical protein